MRDEIDEIVDQHYWIAGLVEKLTGSCYPRADHEVISMTEDVGYVWISRGTEP